MKTFLNSRVVLAILLMLGIFASLRIDIAAAQTTDPVDVVRAFLEANSDAKSQADLDKMKSFLAPEVRFMGNPGTPFEYNQSFEEWAPLPQPHITINSLKQTGANTVVADLTIVGEVMPPTRRPYHTASTFTMENGKITGFLEVVSRETYEDLAALQASAPTPAGMPKTGIPDEMSVLGAMGLLGLLSLLLGALIKRSAKWLSQ